MTGGAFQIGGVTAWISRSGYTGKTGSKSPCPAPMSRRSPIS
jgi:hypothetical protein